MNATMTDQGTMKEFGKMGHLEENEDTRSEHSTNEDLLYEKLVEMLIDSQSDELIDNGSYEHARILIKNLLTKVDVADYVGIFTGSLDERGYGPRKIVDAFKKQLDNNFELRILFQKKPSIEKLQNNSFYKEILCNEKYKNLITIRVLNKEFSKNDRHLVTVNDGAFRLEVEHPIEDGGPKAVASFNNEALGKKIRVFFDKLFTSDFSTELKLNAS